MTIDKETVEKVAHLARLELAEDEKEKMIGDMSKILGFMAKLNEINTSGVEPLVYMTEEINVLRDDVVFFIFLLQRCSYPVRRADPECRA